MKLFRENLLLLVVAQAVIGAILLAAYDNFTKSTIPADPAARSKRTLVRGAIFSAIAGLALIYIGGGGGGGEKTLSEPFYSG